MTADDFPNLRALPALREKATAGPWFHWDEEVRGASRKHITSVESCHEDAALIVAAVNAVPDIERLLGRCDAQAQEIEALRSMQTAVVTWHSARFPDAEAPLVFAKAAEELGEVATAMLAEIGTTSATGKPGDVAAEAADVVIAVLALVGRWWPDRDVMAEVDKKLAVLSTPGAHPASRFAASTPSDEAERT